ncbi:MAG: Fe-S cluster assembly ATPase SufC [Actinobacteria bacterium]|nr:MAG: Fe-S cluster assembly ATPase SufC [Actinomycetota bacterium]
MSILRVSDLHASVGTFEALHGVSLEIESGEVHVLMGPNGSGKSTLAHALMGRPEYEVTSGSVTIDGVELLGLPTWERAAQGLLLAMQYPVQVPGVTVLELVTAAARAAHPEDPSVVADASERLAKEANRLGVRDELLARGVNDEFSGGEQKRMETLQLTVLRPKFAVLDEIDSGLDVDALRDVARRVEAMTKEDELGLLAITHYARLLVELQPDRVHVLMAGRIVASGGSELVEELEEVGYEGLAARLGIQTLAVEKPPEADPFADPGF